MATVDWSHVAAASAEKHGLDPTYFVNQIRAESNFNPRAGSGAGAQGIAQIMPATAASWHVDPWKPKQALDAAALHMAQYVKQFGSYRDALVAYNAGPGRVGKPLYAETANYVQKILGGDGPGQTKLSSAHAAPAGSQRVTTTPGTSTTTARFSPAQAAVLSRAFADRPEYLALLTHAMANPTVTETMPSIAVTNTAKQQVAGTGATGGLRSKLVQTAKAEVGTVAAQAMKYIRAAGGTGQEAWCGDFVQYVFKQNGLKPPPARSVPGLLSWARQNHKLASTGHAGDLAMFDWDSDGTPDHVELVTGGKGAGRYTTIGGNTSGPQGSSQVAAKNRSSNILGFVNAVGA